MDDKLNPKPTKCLSIELKAHFLLWGGGGNPGERERSRGMRVKGRDEMI
jgi:hypothetical protein